MFSRPHRKASLSVLGLYNYDATIFDGMTVPEGVDKDEVVAEILKETANLETAVPNAPLLKILITHWSKINQWNWSKLFETTQFEYNPIWNKDGVITETRTRNNERTTGNTRTESGTDTTSGTSENQVQGFNSNTYQPSDQSIDSGTDTHSNTSTESGTDNTEESETNERVEQGNIGLTSTQQLIEEERKVSMFNIYKTIAEDFKKEFCILVY